jgi:hypothetical protein
VAEVRNIHGIGRYIDGTASGEVFVDFGEIDDNRYVQFRDFIADTREAGDDPYEDDEAKLAQLLRFVEDVERATGGSFDTARLVPEDLFPDHIRDWSEEAYVLPQEISNCVDWAKFADRCRDSYTAVPLGDDTVLVKV